MSITRVCAEEEHAPTPKPELHPMFDLLLILLARKRLLARCTLAALMVGAGLTYLTRPTYLATATIMPPQKAQSSLSALMTQIGTAAGLDGAANVLQSPSDLYVRLLQSRTIADHASDRFHLQQHWNAKTVVAAEEEFEAHALFAVAKNGLIRISVSDHDPQLASDLANYLADALREMNATLATTEAAQRRQFYEHELQNERSALNAAEDDLAKTSRQTGLLAPGGQAELALRGAADIRSQISAREVALQKLRVYASEDNPDVQLVENEIQSLRQQLGKQEKGEGHGSPGDMEPGTRQLPEKSLDYARKLREAKYHETIFALLSRQYEAARIDEGRSAEVIQVVGRAVAPDFRSGPSRLLILTGAGVVGFCVGCALVFFLGSMERTDRKSGFADKLAVLFGDANGTEKELPPTQAPTLKRRSILKIRNPKDIPFYSTPFKLFFAEWAIMLLTFLLHISFASYPEGSVAILLFVLATAGFLAGFLTLRWSYAARNYTPRGTSEYYEVQRDRLRWFHGICFVIVVAIMVMNLKKFGLPPIFGAIGIANTLDYQEYGSLRVPMTTAVLSIFLTASLEKAAWRRWILYLFCPACFLLYSSRGFLLMMLFQALVVFSLRTGKSKRTIYLIATATLVVAVFASNFIGNSRNSLGIDALLGYLQIKQRYYNWPAAWLWVTSYIATPFSNMCWIVRVFQYQHPSFNFLYSAFPGERAVQSFEMVGDLGSEKIIDGVHTYMAKYFIDFWYFGILGINYIWGLISAALQAGNRLTRNYLVSGVLLGCMSFMFFSDFLTILSIMLEMLVMVLVQAYVILPVDPVTGKAQPRKPSYGNAVAA